MQNDEQDEMTYAQYRNIALIALLISFIIILFLPIVTLSITPHEEVVENMAGGEESRMTFIWKMKATPAGWIAGKPIASPFYDNPFASYQNPCEIGLTKCEWELGYYSGIEQEANENNSEV